MACLLELVLHDGVLVLQVAVEDNAQHTSVLDTQKKTEVQTSNDLGLARDDLLKVNLLLQFLRNKFNSSCGSVANKLKIHVILLVPSTDHHFGDVRLDTLDVGQT